MKQLLSRIRDVGIPGLYRKGSSLFFQGEVPRQVVLVLDGVVRAYTITSEGEEAIINLYGKGSVLPLAWLTDQATTALFNYEAVNDVRVLKVSKDLFNTILRTDLEAQKDFIDTVSKSQASLLLRITGLSQPRAAEKICYTLYFLVFRYGLERGNDMYEIDLKLTQGMLAQLIGQTRESTAKNLKVLKEAGIVDYTTSTYTVNKKRLEQYLGEETFRELDLKN